MNLEDLKKLNEIYRQNSNLLPEEIKKMENLASQLVQFTVPISMLIHGAKSIDKDMSNLLLEGIVSNLILNNSESFDEALVKLDGIRKTIISMDKKLVEG